LRFGLIVNIPGPPLLAKLAENFLMGKYRAVGLHHVASDEKRNFDIAPAYSIARKVTVDNFHDLPLHISYNEYITLKTIRIHYIGLM
jgi:hypothetical protein